MHRSHQVNFRLVPGGYEASFWRVSGVGRMMKRETTLSIFIPWTGEPLEYSPDLLRRLAAAMEAERLPYSPRSRGPASPEGDHRGE